MRPAVISDEMAERLAAIGYERQVIMPPDQHMLDGSIQAVDAAVAQDARGTTMYMFQMEFDEGDLDLLQHEGKIWFTMWGAVVPFGFQVTA